MNNNLPECRYLVTKLGYINAAVLLSFIKVLNHSNPQGRGQKSLPYINIR